MDDSKDKNLKVKHFPPFLRGKKESSTAVQPQTLLNSDDVLLEIMDETKRQEIGKIKTLSNQMIQVYLGRSLPLDAPVRVWLSVDCAIKGRIMYCSEEERSHCARIQFTTASGAGRRQEPRFDANGEAATLSLLDQRQPGTYQARLVDVSKSGMGLSTTQRIPRGAWVRVDLPSAIAFGEVVHCRQESAHEFRVGLVTETVLFRSDEPPPESQETSGTILRGLRSGWKRLLGI